MSGGNSRSFDGLPPMSLIRAKQSTILMDS
jgi:hypothetical protein